MSDGVYVSDEELGQEAAIRAVIGDAFGRSEEARLVDELRADGVLAMSLVAIEAGVLRGHVAMSHMRSPSRALGLAPLSVRTPDQRRGIGTRLVQEAITRARLRHYDIVFVLGDPDYYTRLGFACAAATAFTSRYAGPHFMALQLSSPPVAPCPAVYADALEFWSEPATPRNSEGTVQ